MPLYYSLITISIVIIFCNSIKCAEIQEIFNVNLLKFHTKSTPFPISKIPLLPTDARKPKLPQALYMEICDYLGFDDLIAFSETCKDTANATRAWLAARLARINPYHVFEQNWINMMIYKMINDEKLTEDHLDLITFKFIINIPHNPRQWHILRLLHSTVYGIDTPLPLNQRDWRISFIRRVQSFDMQKTIKFANEYYDNFPEYLRCEYFHWIELIEFFSKKPSLEEQTLLRNSYNVRSQHHYSGAFAIPDEFEIIFQENVHRENA